MRRNVKGAWVACNAVRACDRLTRTSSSSVGAPVHEPLASAAIHQTWRFAGGTAQAKRHLHRPRSPQRWEPPAGQEGDGRVRGPQARGWTARQHKRSSQQSEQAAWAQKYEMEFLGSNPAVQQMFSQNRSVPGSTHVAGGNIDALVPKLLASNALRVPKESESGGSQLEDTDKKALHFRRVARAAWIRDSAAPDATTKQCRLCEREFLTHANAQFGLCHPCYRQGKRSNAPRRSPQLGDPHGSVTEQQPAVTGASAVQRITGSQQTPSRTPQERSGTVGPFTSASEPPKAPTIPTNRPLWQLPPWQRAALEKAAAAEQAASSSETASSAQQSISPPTRPRQKLRQIQLPEDVTVRQLASLLGQSQHDVERVLTELGDVVQSPEDAVATDSAELVALEFGRMVTVSPASKDADTDAERRAAVITVMGHVDHGKTSLLDALRRTSVAAGEAGGITQHIGAFEVAMPESGASLTFLDTPGHAAFTAMRARGAAATDLVVLVVAADDGIMPQTREAIQHAQAAKVPIVVAVSKCDLPTADLERVKVQLAGAGLDLEENGGSVPLIPTAAPQGTGLRELEEALLFQAELLELRASRSRVGEAVVVEARLERGQGAVATVIVKRGTLRAGQYVSVGTEWGRVKTIRGTGGRLVEEALPGQPAEISGLRGVPLAGDLLAVVPTEERARKLSAARSERKEEYQHIRRASAIHQASDDGAEAASDLPCLKLIVKADVQGSAEALCEAIRAMASDMVNIRVIRADVGPVTTNDIHYAASADAKVLAFNVKSEAEAGLEAKQLGVQVCMQKVIYAALEEVGELMAALAPRVAEEEVLGRAHVLQLFPVKTKKGAPEACIAGCRITEGSIKGSLPYRVVRDGEVIHEGVCTSIHRHKLQVETVGKGTECGIILQDFSDFRQGDVLLCVNTKHRAATSKEVASAAF